MIQRKRTIKESRSVACAAERRVGRRMISCTVLSLLIVVLHFSSLVAAVSGYVGATLGFANSKFDKEHFSFESVDLTGTETAWRLLGGCQFTANFGVEGGYVNLGKPRVHEQVYGDFFEAKLTGFELALVGTLPLGKGFSALAKGGKLFWKSEMASQITYVTNGTASETGNCLALGFGLKYEIAKRLAIRAEFTRYTVDKTKAGVGDLNFISINGLFMFGRKWR
jgi:OmpA-OmpF porin, OOP family